jgi:ribonuclease Z
MRKTVPGKIIPLAAVAALCFALGLTTSAAYAADDFTVTLLGTGVPTPSPDRFSASTLVEVGGQRLLFDMGRGVTIRLWQKRIPLGAVDAHFLTHLHSDHVVGLPDLWLSGWLHAPFGGRKKPFTVYGPRGTKKLMAGLWEAFSEDRRIRMEDEHYPLAGLETDARDISPGVVYENDDIVVTAFDVDHGARIKPAYGYKVSYRGRSVVLSGDTRYDLNVERAARGADLLIHEVAMIPEKAIAEFPPYKEVLEHHITPEQAGRLFSAARPKMAVYSHLVLLGFPPKGIPAPTPDDLIAATRKTYDGPLVVGSDLMSFKIDDKGVSILDPSRK